MYSGVQGNAFSNENRVLTVKYKSARIFLNYTKSFHELKTKNCTTYNHFRFLIFFINNRYLTVKLVPISRIIIVVYISVPSRCAITLVSYTPKFYHIDFMHLKFRKYETGWMKSSILLLSVFFLIIKKNCVCYKKKIPLCLNT